VNYTVVVPEPIRDEIARWDLSLEAEDELYAQLEAPITQEALDAMWRLPGPGFVFVYSFDGPDPLILGLTHFYTFWLVYGAKDDHLYIHQCDYKRTGDWGPGE